MAYTCETPVNSGELKERDDSDEANKEAGKWIIPRRVRKKRESTHSSHLNEFSRRLKHVKSVKNVMVHLITFLSSSTSIYHHNLNRTSIFHSSSQHHISYSLWMDGEHINHFYCYHLL
ncbi:hypothetical protein Pst134EA_011164 [Puccinia striiformis f. sp. tritici]|uniref:hypothetical protein n=1 Tax=Puccinia striiformis f. sp. tritici TaxID=168172 RepID=UPI0020089B5E|nr:hypothetical protein Pst134EA_011164 [Puccinia striiformis f. sp. tritici]KAH9467522.1 hypothetical protein Pst134EA_011164 [Puccinia striiformis f. sp. tritici]KAI9609675.1 hypothetical protein KEM48_002847 [Puccinia striiformis f. sp. tritici PST-130]